MHFRTLRLAVVGLLALVASGATSDPYDPHRFMLARSHFEKAMKLLSGARDAEAETELQEAVRLFPQLVEAHIQLGSISMKRGDFTQGLERYLAARQSLADLQGLQHAQEIERQRRLQESLDVLREHIADLRRSPRSSDAGRIEEETVRLEKLEREKSFAQPAAETPFNPVIHFLVGTALMKLERFDAAREEFSQALVLQPKFGEVHNNLAVLDFYRREYAGCWEHVHSAEAAGVKVDPLFRAELAALSPEPGRAAEP